MTATVCSINPPGHDWQNGLTCRWCRDTRTVTEAILSQLSSRRGGDPASARQLLDAYRAEVLAEAKVETVAWLVKKASEQPMQDAAVLASKLDRGAVRIFIRTDHYRDAMDAHRAKVLAEAAAFVGNDDTCDCGGCDTCIPNKLAAGLRELAGEKATAPAASATPGPTGRVAQLLDAIRTGRGRWTTVRAAQFYRDNGIEPPGAQWSRTRTVARGDLRDLTVWGHLLRHEEPGRQYYTLKTKKDRV